VETWDFSIVSMWWSECVISKLHSLHRNKIHRLIENLIRISDHLVILKFCSKTTSHHPQLHLTWD